MVSTERTAVHAFCIAHCHRIYNSARKKSECARSHCLSRVTGVSYFEINYRDLDDNPDYTIYDEAKLFAKEIDIAFRTYRAEVGKSVLDHDDDDVNRWLEAYAVQRFWESQAGFSYPADITTCEAKLTYTATLDAEYNAEKTSVEVAVEAAASLQVQQCNTEAWLATRVVGATDNHISAGDMVTD
eukprot:3936-Heterococcus_DN1.PRE.2